MAIQQNGFYYNGQLVRYINQFMAVFTGLQVLIGKYKDKEDQLIPVDIHYAHMDRVVASILSDNTQNKPIKLPIMSVYMSGLSIAMNRARGVGTQRRSTFTPVGGLVPDDMKVVYQRMPVPFTLTMELNIYTSNTNQHFQILEQILPLFDPSLTFQTGDAPFDWTRLSQIELKDVTLDTNFPISTDRRIIQSKLVFEMPIELDTPADVRRNFIEQIFIRIGNVSEIAEDNYDIIADLDSQGLLYELVATTDNLPFE